MDSLLAKGNNGLQNRPFYDEDFGNLQTPLPYPVPKSPEKCKMGPKRARNGSPAGRPAGGRPAPKCAYLGGGCKIDFFQNPEMRPAAKRTLTQRRV